MNAENEYKDWLTYDQAAERLGCSKKTIQRLVNEGALTKARRRGESASFVPLEQVVALETPKPVGEDQ